MKKKILNILEYMVYIIIIIGSYYVGTNVETEWIFNLFREPVSLEEIENNPLKSYLGRQPGEGIPVVTSALQFEDDTYTWEDYVTIEPVAIIGTGGYRVLNADAANRRYRTTRRGYQRRVNPLDKYTEHIRIFKDYLYNELYVVEFSDGTYMGVYMSDYYAKQFKRGIKVTFPIGRLDISNSHEEEWLKSVGVPLDEEHYLDLIDNEGYEKIEYIDLVIRVIIGILFLVIAIAIYSGIERIYKKIVKESSLSTD